jgi:hypothetical protein
MFRLFHEFLVGGLDVNHVDDNGSTLFGSFCDGVFAYGPTAKAIAKHNSSLRCWLKDLQASGVNLRSFGKAQHRLFKESGGPIDYYTSSHPGRFDLVRLIGFSHGPSPEDWGLWIYEPSDHFAGEFWHMIERRIEIPGGWSSDVHLFL